jgi:hypothetical protein
MFNKFVLLTTAAALVCAVSAPLAAQAQAPASPPDKVTAKIGAATVMIDYSRPSMRGRKIMGGLVPFDKVWRTGANKATHLITDAELTIGTLAVPAGTYTVYTVPGEKAWTLIINKQTGQWGTQYDQAQDLGRVEMTIAPVPAAVEMFTIAVNATGAKGTLTMEWENTRASIAIEAK